MTKQCCGTCNMAEFKKTPTGRFKRDCVSQCGYHIPMPALPSSVREANVLQPDYLDRRKGYVTPGDGADCSLWAPRTA